MSADATLHELLPWYVAGTLEPEATGRFRAHLDGCPACRAEMVFLQQVKGELERYGAAFLEDHPTSEELVAAVRGTLADERAAVVRAHLEHCVTCAEEAAWVSGEVVFRAASAPAAAPRPVRLAPWAAGIAAALFLAALALFLLSDRGRDATAIVRVHHLPSTELGVESRTVVLLEPGQPEVRLLLDVDLPEAAFPIAVRIEDATGRPVFEARGVEAGALLEGLYLPIDCSRRDCPPGAYTLRVTPSGGNEPELTFSFEVVER